MSPKLAQQCLDVANNLLATNWRYSGYNQEWKEDMLSLAMIECVRKAEGSNHFHIQTVCKDSFQTIIERNREQHRVKQLLESNPVFDNQWNYYEQLFIKENFIRI